MHLSIYSPPNAGMLSGIARGGCRLNVIQSAQSKTPMRALLKNTNTTSQDFMPDVSVGLSE